MIRLSEKSDSNYSLNPENPRRLLKVTCGKNVSVCVKQTVSDFRENKTEAFLSFLMIKEFSSG